MFKEEKFNQFVERMSKEIDAHDKVYGDTWKTMNVLFLEQRFTAKVNEFKLTKNPKKLVSLVNLAMMLNLRMIEDNGREQDD